MKGEGARRDAALSPGRVQAIVDNYYLASRGTKACHESGFVYEALYAEGGFQAATLQRFPCRPDDPCAGSSRSS